MQQPASENALQQPETPSLTDSDTSTPGITVPATPAETEICTPLHALYAFDVLAAKLEGRDHVKAPFDNAADK